MTFNRLKILIVFSFLAGCSDQKGRQPVYQDQPFLQDYSVRYYKKDSSERLNRLLTDRNGVTTVLGSGRALRLGSGQFQFPGTLEPDRSYRPMTDKVVRDMDLYKGHLVFLDEEAVFSNAFAGKLMYRHGMTDARLLCMGDDSTFVVSDGYKILQFKGEQLVSGISTSAGPVVEIVYEGHGKRFMILTENEITVLKKGEKSAESIFTGEGFTCLSADAEHIYLGTSAGYLVLSARTFAVTTPLFSELPVREITAISAVNGHLWFGSALGAFMLREDGGFNYYYGERWLPSNEVTRITAGPENNVMILTSKGVGDIRFESMTLAEKAMRYENQVRQRHIRYGFNCDVVALSNGDLSTFEMGQRDSDNLWTSMYLVSQLFRYKVTGEEEARLNFMESFDAMERLFEITGMDGYFARGFERHGYYKISGGTGGKPTGWVQASDAAWDWRGTTSSDQTVGQMFSLTLLAELTEGEVRARAINLMDRLMTNIIHNDWYLIDFDGKPTLWGKWNPEYVNGFPESVGDRKLYSSNIVGFLQAAHHFTGKELYKEKAEELMQEHGYLENLMRPFSEIGTAEGAGDWAAMLSKSWNHSDDEMYFLAYWCLYPYAFNDGLKEQYREAIREHWEAERPEKNSLWNLCYAMTGAGSFDLDEAAWHLREFPLDMIEWKVVNSHRNDIRPVAPNFRGQTISEVLPPDERPELKHNRNLFTLDRESNGISELSAGDSFLLPYWMGRYLGVISPPVAD